MKKYLLATMAIIVALGLSAFTSKPDKNHSTKSLNAYTRWYHTTDNGTKVGTNFYMGVSKDKTQVSSGCPDQNFPVCAVGSNDDLDEGDLIPDSDGPGDNYILEN